MPGPRESWDLAGALLEGDAVDWDRFPSDSSRQGRIVRSLQTIAALGWGRGGGREPEADRPSRWAWMILSLAAVHVLVGGAGFATGHVGQTPVPPGASALVAAGFTLAAGWLVAGGRKDRRAMDLGGFYLLVAAAFARRFAGVTGGTAWAGLVTGIFPDAFLPAFLWSFVSRFPRVLRFSQADRFSRSGVRISVALGLLLFAWNILLAHLADEPRRHLLHRAHPAGLYWAVLLVLCGTALASIIVRARSAPRDERRRAAVFCGVLLATVAPAVLETLAEVAMPAFSSVMSRAPVRRVASFGLVGLLLLLPVGTAYAVLVERILDVRVVVGRALQYLLARGTLVVLTAIPFAAVVLHGARNRHLSINDLFAGPAGGPVAALTIAGVVLLAVRRRLLDLVDRVFLRASVDLARELPRLAGDLGSARSAAEVIERSEDAIERATGATVARAHLADAAGLLLPARGAMDPLAGDSACGTLLRVDAQPLPVGSREPQTLFGLLPPEEQRWVSETGFVILLPLQRGAALAGFVGVGPKKNGLPFDDSELQFLAGAAHAVALALASHATATAGAAMAGDEPAGECPLCGRISESMRGRCTCGSTLRVAAVPACLNGKFAVARRLGAGGMGVVYRAVDATLDRRVALKTLSRLSHGAAARLAQEARVMAAVVHPYLATIYGVEHWRGAPVLVVELCEGGTLADRLRVNPLPYGEAVRLGWHLASALDELHRAGVLHRDVKPSNIGFTADGMPRLLDFGIASYASAAPLPAALSAAADGPRQTQTIEQGIRILAGTPLYLSPEVVRGGEPDVGLDLWALAVVMYEAIAGRHPFMAASVPDVLARVRKARLPDIRRACPGCPEDLSAAFRRWLAPEPAQRPPSAQALAAELARIAGRGDLHVRDVHPRR